ncbi:MAG: arsenate reductase ArsC [Anaerolineales bacterium]
MDKKNVLFLCTGNSARSQIAEALLRKYASDRFRVYSAGLDPKGVSPLTVEVMDEIGLDIRQQTSDPIKKYMMKQSFRYVITVCAHADEQCPQALWHMGEKLHWPFDDPAQAEGTHAEQLAMFRRVRDEIDAKIRAWMATLEPIAE